MMKSKSTTIYCCNTHLQPHRLCQSLKLGEYNLQPTDWPTLFYHDYNYNPEDELQGLLQGELVVQVTHHFPKKKFTIYDV